MAGFEEAVRVVRRPGDGQRVEFDANLDAQWSARGVLHGGYLLAVLARAAAEVVGDDEHPHLASASAVFIESPRPGPATAIVEVLRTGRTATHVRGQLMQDDKLHVEVHLIQGALSEDDPWWSAVEHITLPDPADCLLVPAQPPGVDYRVDLLEQVEQRLDPRVLGFAVGKPAGHGLIAGYLRMTDGSDWDPVSLLVALDMGPPASLDLGIAGGTPTLQFTAYIRRLPAPGPVWLELRANDVGDDRMDEVMRVWDSKGRLVAHSTQLAAVRIPDGPPA